MPAVYEVFNWAEKKDGPMSDDRLAQAVRVEFITFDRDGVATNHLEPVNCAT